MPHLVLLAVGLVGGFVGSRLVRRRPGRPERAAPGTAIAVAGGTPAPGPSPAAAPAPSGPARHPERAAQVASVARATAAAVGRRKGLSGPELQRACFSEMVRHVRVTRSGRTHAPARYLLRLHPDDLATVDEGRRWFADGLADALAQAARDHGWVLDGGVTIDFEADPGRHPGAPAAMAVPPDQPAGTRPTAPPPAPGRRLAVVRGDTGEQIPLAGGPLTVGRSRDRDVTIDDSRVSRAHARLEERPGGAWVVIDEGSANGTRLRGEELPAHEARPIRPGDVIGVGPVELRVTTAAAGPGGEPGTRALDDSDRTRISGQVLPVEGRWAPQDPDPGGAR